MGDNSPEGGQRQPQEENKLEGIVEGEPVDNADKALDDAAKSGGQSRTRESSKSSHGNLREQRENNPVLGSRSVKCLVIICDTW